MKSLKLFFIICLLTTMSCTHKVAKKEAINRICYIDSVKINPSLREIILMYIHQHPSYKSYCLHPQIRSESVCSNQFNCYACVRHQIEANDALVMPL